MLYSKKFPSQCLTPRSGSTEEVADKTTV